MAGAVEPIAHVGTQRDELEKVASVKRHVDDALVLDDRSDRRVLRRDQRGCSRDLDGLAHLSDLQCKVEASRLLDLQLHIVLRDRAKTRQLYFDVVLAGLQARNVVDTGFVADRRAREIRGRVADHNGNAGNNAAARIVSHAADVGLRMGGHG